MAKLSFSAQIAGWAEKIPEAAEAVRNESAKEVVREMQTLTNEGGRMRYKTGFLWSSLMASASAMPRINPNAKPTEGGSYGFDFGQVEAVIAGASLQDTLYFGYTASYAGHREFGSNGQAPDAFVRSAAQNWDVIVNRNAKRVQQVFGL
jgi:hypothetical protein